MSKPPDDLREPKPGDEDAPIERIEFALGPKDNPDGTAPDADEARRRLETMKYVLEQYAREFGLEVVEPGLYPPVGEGSSTRAQEIAVVAQPAMDQAAEDAKEQRNDLRIGHFKHERNEKGSTTEFTLLELASRERIGDIIKGIGSIVRTVLPIGKVALGIKVGWFKFVAMARHNGEEGQGGESKERDD